MKKTTDNGGYQAGHMYGLPTNRPSGHAYPRDPSQNLSPEIVEDGFARVIDVCNVLVSQEHGSQPIHVGSRFPEGSSDRNAISVNEECVSSGVGNRQRV